MTPLGSYELELALAGEHQLRNLRIAVLAAEQLSDLGFDRIDRRAIERGVARCRWPGRLERVVLDPADGSAALLTVLLDGAHNEGAALALASHLDSLGEPFDLLFGCLERKEVEKILPHLARRARRIVLDCTTGWSCTSASGAPRAAGEARAEGSGCGSGATRSRSRGGAVSLPRG